MRSILPQRVVVCLRLLAHPQDLHMESAAHALHAGEGVASLGKSPQMGKERFQSKLGILSQVQPRFSPSATAWRAARYARCEAG